MSVVKGKRSDSGMEFLKNARDIEEMFIDLRIHKPKRYSFYFDKLLDMSMNLLTEVKSGNSLYPQNLEEAQIRINHFKAGICLCQALVSQLEIIQHKLKDEGVSGGDMVILSGKLTDEIRLLKGMCNGDRKRYRDLPPTLSDEILNALEQRRKEMNGDTEDLIDFGNDSKGEQCGTSEPVAKEQPVRMHPQSSY